MSSTILYICALYKQKIDADKDSQAGAPPACAAVDAGSSMLWHACPAFPCEGGGPRSAPLPLGLGGVPPALLRSARSTASLRGTWRTGPRRSGRRARRCPWQRLALAITRRDARPRRLALEQR